MLRDQRRAAQPAPSEPTIPLRDEAEEERTGVVGQWWFWTAIAVVAAGAAVAVVLLTAKEVAEDPLPGSIGPAIATLRW